MRSTFAIENAPFVLLLGTAAFVAVAERGGGPPGPALSTLCCDASDFQVGGTVHPDIGSEPEVQAVQAVADVAGAAAAGVEALTATCRAIAEELDGPRDELERAAALDDIRFLFGGKQARWDKAARMTATCEVAAKAITAFRARAGGTLSVVIEPPQCTQSVSAGAACQGRCAGSMGCDVAANPVTCEGGRLEVACKGTCVPNPGAALTCTGTCTGTCDGRCAAVEGVACAGRCEGTCKGASDGGAGEGIDAQGNCNGTCEGTCEATAAGVTCSGTCEGTCGTSCQGSADVSVTCDGACEGEFEPIACEGGQLAGGCEVDASCQASCDASVSAATACRPARVTVTLTDATSPLAVAKLEAVLEARLGDMATLQARMVGTAAAFEVVAANVDADFLADIKVACIPTIQSTAVRASREVQAIASASASVLAAVGD